MADIHKTIGELLVMSIWDWVPYGKNDKDFLG